MSETVSHALMMVAAILCVCIFVGLGASMLGSQQTVAGKDNKKVAEANATIEEQRYLAYDGKEIRGDDVISAIQSMARDDIAITVNNGTSTTDYIKKYDVSTGELKDAGQTVKAALGAARNKADTSRYIGSTQVYEGEVIRDKETNAIMQIKFNSVGTSNTSGGGNANASSETGLTDNARTVSFYYNDGTSMTFDVISVNNNSTTATAPDAEPRRTGYIFKGWSIISSIDPDASGLIKKGGSLPAVTKDTEYFAIWKKTETQFIFTIDKDVDWNPGVTPTTNSEGNKQYTFSPASDGTFTIPTDIPKKEGYQFTGWTTNKGSSKPTNQPGTKIDTEDEKINLYPVFVRIAYYVRFDKGQQTVKGSMSDQKVLSLNRTTLNECTYADGTKRFLGWSNGTNTIENCAEIQIVKQTSDTEASGFINGTSATFETAKRGDDGTAYNILLKATWSDEYTYTLKYLKFEGSNDPAYTEYSGESDNITYSSSSDEGSFAGFVTLRKKAPERAGYQFTGWTVRNVTDGHSEILGTRNTGESVTVEEPESGTHIALTATANWTASSKSYSYYYLFPKPESADDPVMKALTDREDIRSVPGLSTVSYNGKNYLAYERTGDNLSSTSGSMVNANFVSVPGYSAPENEVASYYAKGIVPLLKTKTEGGKKTINYDDTSNSNVIKSIVYKGGTGREPSIATQNEKDKDKFDGDSDAAELYSKFESSIKKNYVQENDKLFHVNIFYIYTSQTYNMTITLDKGVYFAGMSGGNGESIPNIVVKTHHSEASENNGHPYEYDTYKEEERNKSIPEGFNCISGNSDGSSAERTFRVADIPYGKEVVFYVKTGYESGRDLSVGTIRVPFSTYSGSYTPTKLSMKETLDANGTTSSVECTVYKIVITMPDTDLYNYKDYDKNGNKNGTGKDKDDRGVKIKAKDQYINITYTGLSMTDQNGVQHSGSLNGSTYGETKHPVKFSLADVYENENFSLKIAPPDKAPDGYSFLSWMYDGTPVGNENDGVEFKRGYILSYIKNDMTLSAAFGLNNGGKPYSPLIVNNEDGVTVINPNAWDAYTIMMLAFPMKEDETERISKADILSKVDTSQWHLLTDSNGTDTFYETTGEGNAKKKTTVVYYFGYMQTLGAGKKTARFFNTGNFKTNFASSGIDSGINLDSSSQLNYNSIGYRAVAMSEGSFQSVEDAFRSYLPH